MSLSAGERLGPYEIIAPLGAGGMGEVYKARDTRLDRSVAIKVLPEYIAQREDSRARFEREARAVASLNHPNICTLHDIGPNYMVMELIEGETLAARIEKGPIPLEQALKQATQIADALDRAHRAGVTHRDIKPQNIMLTRDGVKVLDFGLAKSTPKSLTPSEATLTAVLTSEGTVLGTPQYMAPEQFEGKEADARSDIWAFGAVLYEMVSGQKAFQGKNYTSLVAAILGAEPQPMATKPWIERLIRRCLEKDAEDRWQTMRDVVIELKSPPADAPIETSKPRWSHTTTAALALSAALGCALAWVLWTRKPAVPAAPVRLELNVTEGENLAPASSRSGAGGVAISPDGRTLVFAVGGQGNIKLHVRSMDSPHSRELPGTERASRPFWSPDSKSIAFVAQGKLKKIDLATGTPVTVCSAGPGRGGTWNEEGVILLGTENGGLQRVSASGGVPSPVAQLNQAGGETQQIYPQFLPGGKQFLYLSVNRDDKKQGIAVGSLDGASPAFLVASPNNAVFDSASGRLLYLNEEGSLLAQRLELNPPKLNGDVVPVAERVRRSLGGNHYADVSVSANGTLFFSQDRRTPRSRFVWRDRAGKDLGTVGELIAADPRISLSPDAKQVAYGEMKENGASDIWVRKIPGGDSVRITFDGGSLPKWSADGKYVYYSKRLRTIFKKPTDGSGAEEVICDGCSDQVTSASPDGKFLLAGAVSIVSLSLEGERKPTPWQSSNFAEGHGVFSPDGRWVAYHSQESGRREVHIQGFPDKRGKWVASQNGGSSPKWRGDGRELYWTSPAGELMAAQIELQPSVVKVGKPEALFRYPASIADSLTVRVFEPARDGRRFLSLEPEGELRDPPMVVILNWAAGLLK